MGELRDVMERARREAPDGGRSLERLTRLRDRRRRSGRVLSGLVALAVTGGVAGGLVVIGQHTGNRSGAGPGDSGSGTTAAGPNLVAAPGQYYYWKFTYVLSDGRAEMTEWSSPDGSGRMVASTTTPDSFGVPQSETWAAGDAPWYAREDLSGLSADPATLLRQLLDRNAPGGASPQLAVTPLPGQDPDTGGLVRAVEALEDAFAPASPPRLRAALYDVLRGLPTARDLGPDTDPAGRAAVAVSITTEGAERTFWFDPGTHVFMAERWQPTESGSDWPLSYLIVQAGGITDGTSSTPDPDSRFFPTADHLPAA